MNTQQVNPDFEFHRAELEQERTSIRKRGIRGMLLTGLCMLFLLVCSLIFAFHLHRLIEAVALVLLALAWSLFFLHGYKTYQRGKAPITGQEIEERRQRNREILYQTARGILPTEIRPWYMVLEGLFAVFCIGTGINAYFDDPHIPSWGNIGVLVFLLLGLGIGLGIIRDIIRGRTMAKNSARTLAQKLIEGEMTGGE